VVESSATLSSGGIAGVVIACAILVVLVVIVSVMLIRGRRSKIRAEVKMPSSLAGFAFSSPISQPHTSALSSASESNPRSISMSGNLPKFATPVLGDLEEPMVEPYLVVE
jgi:hypothetical protein